MSWSGSSRSPRNTIARTAIWIVIVLLTTLDSTAVSVRRVWFQRVNAKAVLTSASQPMISQPVASSARPALQRHAHAEQHHGADRPCWRR